MDLNDALRSVAGTSPLADFIIQRRFGDMVSEASTVVEPSQLTDAQHENIVDAIAASKYTGTGEKAVRELSSVVLRLLDQLSQAHVNESEPESEREDEDLSDKLALFRESIRTARVGDLKCYYTAEKFKGMSRSTRVMIAKELVEHAASHDKQPADIWSTLAQNNGQL